MKITENYMEKVYAGWLGKIIGIRLGAPIEGWTCLLYTSDAAETERV